MVEKPAPLATDQRDTDTNHAWNELQSNGLLWFINRMVFHPLGFALAFNVSQEDGVPSSWTMLGDGQEPWTFSSQDDDECFAAAMKFLHRLNARTRKSAQYAGVLRVYLQGDEASVSVPSGFLRDIVSFMTPPLRPDELVDKFRYRMDFCTVCGGMVFLRVAGDDRFWVHRTEPADEHIPVVEEGKDEWCESP